MHHHRPTGLQVGAALRGKEINMKTTGAELRSEAAIYAEGTELTADEMVRLYGEYCVACEEAGDVADDFQRWAEREGYGG